MRQLALHFVNIRLQLIDIGVEGTARYWQYLFQFAHQVHAVPPKFIKIDKILEEDVDESGTPDSICKCNARLWVACF